MTDNVDVPREVPSLPEPPAPSTNPGPAVPPVEPGEPNPPLPDPGPRDGTHTHDGVSPDEPDVGEAFAEGFEHPGE